MKKLLQVLTVVLFLMSMVACGDAKPKNIEGTLEELMTKVYEGIPEEERPMMLMQTKLDEETETWFIGTDKLDYVEGLASESGVGSIAHSVVLIRMSDDADMEKAKELIKSSIDPRKWICVGVEDDEVIVENNGNLILVVLDSSEHASTLKENFLNLK